MTDVAKYQAPMAQDALKNLPPELLTQKRFFPVRIVNGRKVPCVTGWQSPENQMLAQDAIKETGLIGMDICGHEHGADYFFVDFDHVFDTNGNFRFTDAERWDNYLSSAETYRELSISGEGLHFLFAPTPNKFPVLKGDNSKNAIYFDRASSKIELFYKSTRYVLLTGKDATNVEIVSGEVADEFCQQLVNQLPAQETSTPSKSARSRNTTADTPEYTAFRIRRMLDFISVAKGDYNKWIDVGFALFNEGMQLSDWEQWSRKQPEFKEGECASKWKGFRYDPTGISVKSLYRWAEEGGYSESETRQEYNREIFKGDSSDIAFARRFERIFGNRVRWLGDSERWLIYNSGVWTRGTESNSCVLPFAMNAERLLSRTANNEFAKDLARKITSAKKISAAITLLKGIESIRITADDLNRHNELLNVQNGVVDLSNGELYPHAPELLLMQQCRADYEPNATSPLVDKFFRDIQPDEQTRAGLLRWLGYCLTGESSEEKFMVWYGTGANGKGVLSKTLLYLLGNYGAGLAPRALLRSNRAVDANAATTALNAIEDARFAISEELPADAELDASLVKNLTGGDKINLRRNFGEYRAIENRAKINISGNYLPKIENTADNGLLRRMLSMPFNMRFVKPIATADPQLKTKMLLPDNLRGLLSLLVREAVAWYNNGLIVSDQMEDTTQKLLGQSDFVAQFIEDFYTIDPNGEVNAKTFLDELKSSYHVECHRLRRVDLIKLITHNSAITYTKGKHNANVFKGLSKKYFN